MARSNENAGYGDPLAHGRSWFCSNPPLIDVLGQPWSAGFAVRSHVVRPVRKDARLLRVARE
jgi:hypothetical protein